MLSSLINFFAGIQTYLIVGVFTLGLGAYEGYHFERARFDAYQTKVEAEGKKQEEHTKEVIAQQQKATEDIKNGFKETITNLHNYYNHRVYVNASSRKVSTIPTTTSRTDEEANNQLFIGQCAETTGQLVYLQKWVNDQVQIGK